MHNSYKVSRDVKKLFADASSKPETVRAALEFWARYTAIDLCWVKFEELQGAIQTRVQEMGEAAANLQSAECADMMRRIHSLSVFQSTALLGVSTWELDEFPDRLRRLVEELPDLPGEVTDHCRNDFAPAMTQLQHMVDHLIYGDPVYWSEISRKRS